MEKIKFVPSIILHQSHDKNEHKRNPRPRGGLFAVSLVPDQSEELSFQAFYSHIAGPRREFMTVFKDQNIRLVNKNRDVAGPRPISSRAPGNTLRSFEFMCRATIRPGAPGTMAHCSSWPKPGSDCPRRHAAAAGFNAFTGSAPGRPFKKQWTFNFNFVNIYPSRGQCGRCHPKSLG